MKFIYIMISLFLISCGKNQRVKTIIPKEFSKYVQKFEELSTNSYVNKPARVVGVVMTLTDSLDNETNGVCYKEELDKSNFGTQLYIMFNGVTKSQKYIEISSTYWRYATDAEKEALIFHELGHCMLNREHLDGFNLQNNRYYSIMNYFSFEGEIYTRNYQYYIRELFKANGFNSNEISSNNYISFNASYYNTYSIVSNSITDSNRSENLVSIDNSEIIDSYDEAIEISKDKNHECVKTLEDYHKKNGNQE